ncbi:HAD-IA family hydrolase [Candidatus Woesearchaeota archaeon]|nr:HAD-IA family hydrolase [Candidatus Woesearchaeota archaeon]
MDKKAIIFDFYGTLVDEETGYRGFIEKNTNLDPKIAVKNWFLFQREIIFNQKYIPFKEVLRKTYYKLTKSKQTTFSEIFSNIKPYPEVIKILNKLKKHYKIGVLTNSDNDLLELVLKNVNFNFDIIITAESLNCYKPNKKNYGAILEKLGIKVKEALFVSASSWDIKAAREFGLETIHLDRKEGKKLGDLKWNI